MDRRRTLMGGALTAAAVLGLGGVQLLPATAPTAHADGLVAYGSCAEMLTHYRAELAATVTAWGVGGGGWPVAMARESAATTDSAGAAGDAVGSGPTGTNVQEQGVDEPDLVKLSDGRLVVLTGDRLRVVSAAAEPVVLGSLRVGDGRSYGGELLLDGDRALVAMPSFRDDAGRADRRRRRPPATSPPVCSGQGPRPPAWCWSTSPATSRGCSRRPSWTGST